MKVTLIDNVVQYGAAIYWLLLLLGVYLVTLAALKENDLRWPAIWAAFTTLFLFGFTDYSPSITEFTMGIVAYLLMGVAYASYRWARLVYNIKTFSNNLGGDNNCELIARAFGPNDSGGCVVLPPDPVQFRTRLLLYVLYWPCFSVLYFVGPVQAKLSASVWRILTKVSKSIYDS